MFRRSTLLLLLLLITGFLSACARNEPAGPDHQELETPVGEAVLRHMLALFPYRDEAKQLTIVLGPKQDAASPEFENRFSDVGLKITPSKQLVAGAVNGEVRVFDGTTNQPPLILQITSLTPSGDKAGEFEAIAAWAFKKEARRVKLRVLSPEGQPLEIRLIGDIPIPLRNQDGMPPAEATPG